MAKTSDPGRAWIDLHSGGFAFHKELDPPRMTFALKGELDLATAPSLEREIEAVAWQQLAELLFDLSELTFIDSTGLSVLIRAAQRAAAAGLWFSVTRVPEQPRKLFTLAGVTNRLNIQP